MESTLHILESATSAMSGAVRHYLPSEYNLTISIQRHKQKNKDKQTQVPATVPGNHGTAAGGDQVGPATLPNPVTPEVDPVIPEIYHTTHRGELFLQHDSGPDPDRICIFTTKDNLEFLCDCEHWFANGTFKKVLPPFHQVYTIHGMLTYSWDMRQEAVLVAACMLPDKSEVGLGIIILLAY